MVSTTQKERKQQAGRLMPARTPLLFLLLLLASRSCPSNSFSGIRPTTPAVQLKPWCEAKIDYSYANHFMSDTHRATDPYFDEERGPEKVYNAREGVFNDEENVIEAPSLDRCGFEACYKPTKVRNFKDIDQLADVYLQELRELIQSKFDSKILAAYFWYYRYRGEDFDMSGRSQVKTFSNAPVMPLAHIDTNITAWKMEELLFEVGRICDQHCIYEEDNEEIDMDDIERYLVDEHKRFVMVNTWRSLGDEPVRRKPLALYNVEYDGNHPQKKFPRGRPNVDKSRWYVFPELTNQECLLFKQYDRRVEKKSDIWHCCLEDVDNVGAEPRRSFEIRSLIILDEEVPEEQDRFLLEDEARQRGQR